MLTLLDTLEFLALLLKLETVFQSIFVFPYSRFHCNNIHEFFTLPQDYLGVYKMPLDQPIRVSPDEINACLSKIDIVMHVIEQRQPQAPGYRNITVKDVRIRRAQVKT
jgi:hypothetical protein